MRLSLIPLMPSPPLPRLILAGLLLVPLSFATGAEKESPTKVGDAMFADYFERETAKIADRCLADIHSADEWRAKRPEYRRQLLEMLGLDPFPERTDLKPVITGTLEKDGIVVEKLYFQSRPGLYVTGNLYRRKDLDKPVPAVLYVCGHGQVKKNGIAYGSKAHYQHHGYWLARHGYVCLVIDTLQLGEIEGIHHGTYRYGMWWWINRGYTPAGVEAWNCIRALDYLQSRKEVDPEKLGVTGRSGGGAYSWWISTIDDRIKCAVPTAGITDMTNYVTDGKVEGHCDCMFMVNTYQWDYPQLLAMVAPRPLLLANTDTDPIFPLDGVVRTFEHGRHIYALHKSAPLLGLNITAGGHNDTQELQVHAIRWLDRHLKGEQPLIEDAAKKMFEPEELKVFDELPADQLNTKIHETFVPLAAAPTVPGDAAAWAGMRDEWMRQLKEKSFRAWPSDWKVEGLRGVERVNLDLAIALHRFEYQSTGMALPLFAITPQDVGRVKSVVVHVLDEPGWNDALAWSPAFDPASNEKRAKLNADAWTRFSDEDAAKLTAVHLFVPPRGVGPTAFDTSERKQVQNRRRFYLLGQTLDGMQVLDVRAALRSIDALPGAERPSTTTLPSLAGLPVELRAEGPMAGVALYAALYEPNVKRLTLDKLPSSHREGPYFLNVQRFMDMPAAVAMAAERAEVVLRDAEAADWKFPVQVAEKLGWKNRVRVEPPDVAGK